MILVDTSVWSLALRRAATQLSEGQVQIKRELAELIREGRAQLIGPVRQELLSGIRGDAQYERRASQGKCFYQPYFGCREFPVYFEMVESAQTQPFPLNLDLGWMLYDVFDLTNESPTLDAVPFISVFDAAINGGVIDVPPYTSVAVRKPGTH